MAPIHIAVQEANIVQAIILLLQSIFHQEHHILTPIIQPVTFRQAVTVHLPTHQHITHPALTEPPILHIILHQLTTTQITHLEQLEILMEKLKGQAVQGMSS